MLNYEGEAVPPVPDVRRRVTVYRGQKIWDSSLTIESSSLRRSAGPRVDQEQWTKGLLGQFRRSIAGAMRGDPGSKKRLEDLLLTAQQTSFQNPFVSCSFSYAVARGFANAGDNLGYVMTIEGPWYSGLDFEFLRSMFGLQGGVFDYLHEFGLPEKLDSPFTLVRVERADDPWSATTRIGP